MFADPENPDDRGYLALSFALWTLFGASCLYVLRDRLAESGERLGRSAVHGVLLFVLSVMLGDRMLATTAMAREEPMSGTMLRMTLDDVPSFSLVLTNYYQTHFLLQYGLYVEGRRPDLVETQVNLGGVNGQAHRAHFRTRHPEYAAIASAYDREGGFPLNQVLDDARSRSIVLEPEPGLWGVPALEGHEGRVLRQEILRRSGPGFVFNTLGGRLHRSRCGFPRNMSTLRALVASPKGLGLRSQLGFTFLERTLFQIRRGDARCARENLDVLTRLAGEGATLERLEGYVTKLEATADAQGVDSSMPFRRLPFPFP
jgi:hypothetical protein